MHDRLERHQVWIYLVAILAGLALGSRAPAVSPVFETLLWPVLAGLLYATFTQVPLMRLPSAFRDRRFMTALLLGNFVFIPGLVWLLLGLLPDDPAIRLGVLLVLLVPCTDWFISFTLLGRGDASRAIAAAPVLLLAQLLLLPVWLWLFLGRSPIEATMIGQLLTAFAVLILVPLVLAWLTERHAARHRSGAILVARLGRLPVPLLALVVFLIAASQVTVVTGLLPVLGQVLLAFLLFLVAAAGLGRLLGTLFRLEPPAARTLVFSLGTRNSFVVLPLALSLPETWQAAVVVIVFQSLVELFGMVAYLAWVPRWLIPEPRASSRCPPGTDP